MTRFLASPRYGRGKIPLGCVGGPENLERAVVYLASNASRCHTGDTLVIDGEKLNAN